jgi:hypothetical protein
MVSMGRYPAGTLVALCALSCSPTGGPAAIEGGDGGRNRDASAAGRTGADASPESSIDASADDETAQDAAPTSSNDNDTGVGSKDATGAEATADDAATRCPAGALLCEDFDKYASAADLAPAWMVTATAATLTVDATKPFGPSGKALHVVAPPGTPTGVIVKQGAPLFPIAGNVLYGRVMLWLTQTPGGFYHWNDMQAAGTLPGSTQYAKYGWGGQGGKVLAGYTVRDNPAGPALVDCSKPSATAIPEKRWVCVEWEFDGMANDMHYWFDGTLLADVDVIKTGTRCVNARDLGSTWQAPVFDSLSVGWQQYQPSNGALEFWMDELVVGTKKIGCPAP